MRVPRYPAMADPISSVRVRRRCSLDCDAGRPPIAHGVRATSEREVQHTMTSTTASTESGPQPADASASRRFTRAIGFTAVVASAALAGLGLVWLLAPGLNPFADDAMASLLSSVAGPVAVAIVALALGVAGVALAMLLRLGSRASHRALAGFGAAALALAIGLTLGSMGIIMYAGYLFGLAAVAAGVVTIAVTLVRAPRLGVFLLAGVLAAAAAAVWLAGLTLDGILEFAAAFGGALAEQAGNIAVAAVIVVDTIVWTAVAISTLRTASAGRRFESWLVRHRRILTILAALGPVPYAIARVSWLTPWPLFGPTSDDLSPATLATGLMLGAGAVAASVLTLGLILPWGRTFPKWMPRIGGRSVPVAAAVVPGSIAAGVICLSAVPMLLMTRMSADSPFDAVLVNLVLPLWFWGPMLALAVWAYAAWRRRMALGAA